MSSLHPDLRRRLEKDVKSARKLAERGSVATLAQLGAGEAKAPGHLTKEEAGLRLMK